jgi:hypothetical protein
MIHMTTGEGNGVQNWTLEAASPGDLARVIEPGRQLTMASTRICPQSNPPTSQSRPIVRHCASSSPCRDAVCHSVLLSDCGGDEVAEAEKHCRSSRAPGTVPTSLSSQQQAGQAIRSARLATQVNEIFVGRFKRLTLHCLQGDLLSQKDITHCEIALRCKAPVRDYIAPSIQFVNVHCPAAPDAVSGPAVRTHDLKLAQSVPLLRLLRAQP